MIESLSWAEIEDLTGWLVRIQAKESDWHRTGWYKVVEKQDKSGNVWGSFGNSEEEAIENYKQTYSFDWAFFDKGVKDTNPERINKYIISPIRKIF